ncbi:MAG: DNA cytosine methyltransferase [Brevundimonas sp.]
MPSFYEFFAGGGMARAGLGAAWQCLFANDFDAKKVESYSTNWGGDEIVEDDVNNVDAAKLPGYADLIWASFPCQDLSLAGGGAGLKGTRSGTFWPFWSKVQSLAAQGRKPSFVVLENVTGMLSSHKGKDFQAICQAMHDGGYKFGAVVVDAAHFVPQSRKRVFIVGVSVENTLDPAFVQDAPHDVWHPKPLRTAHAHLNPDLQRAWVWWRLPDVSSRNVQFIDFFEEHPKDVAWHSKEETAKLLGMMSDRNRRKLEDAVRKGERVVGTLYRRTRPSPTGGVQRAEIRLDGTAGCLRTPSGGSSRQIVVCSDAKGVRSRLISAREAARLMGLEDSYKLPKNYNDAYHLLGDGLAVPAVSFVANSLLLPMTKADMARAA